MAWRNELLMWAARSCSCENWHMAVLCCTSPNKGQKCAKRSWENVISYAQYNTEHIQTFRVEIGGQECVVNTRAPTRLFTLPLNEMIWDYSSCSPQIKVQDSLIQYINMAQISLIILLLLYYHYMFLSSINLGKYHPTCWLVIIMQAIN